MNHMLSSTTSLREQYAELRSDHPKVRIRDAAKRLGVSELDLLELSLGKTVTRLEGDWKELLKAVKPLNEVMALTRNEFAVHERKGVYDNISFMAEGKMGVAVNPDIDLRFFMWQWEYGYAVTVDHGKRVMHSLQFFNARGEAVHKIYLTKNSDKAAFQALVEIFKASDQTSITQVDRSSVERPTEKPDAEVDVEAFQKAWLALEDTHDFFPLLREYGLQRTQALRLAPKGYAQKISNEGVVNMFEQVAERGLEMMVFVNSPGCIQIHTGPVKKLFPMNQWFNIMDPKFNLHLNLDGLAETWIVRKPTKDGIVTGLEVFDQEGQQIVYCFGKRKPGIPELEGWREIIANTLQAHVV